MSQEDDQNLTLRKRSSSNDSHFAHTSLKIKEEQFPKTGYIHFMEHNRLYMAILAY